MYTSNVKSKYKKFKKQRLCQGDIIRDVSFSLTGSSFGSSKDDVYLKYAVVLSQDCDVDNDFKARKKGNIVNDKYLPTILVCPAYPAEDLFNGRHIDGWTMELKYQKDIEKMKKNFFNRYHYLEQEANLSVPELVIDFKHFFTIPTALLYKQKKGYIATINELFREELSQRFAYFLSRLGMPEFKSEISTIVPMTTP